MKNTLQEAYLLMSTHKAAYYVALLLLLTSFSSDDPKTKIPGGCTYYGDPMPKESYFYEAGDEEETAVKDIVKATGLPRNFRLLSASDVSNAAATTLYNTYTKSYERVILYNWEFINAIRSDAGEWGVKAVFAHEIGHHLSGHLVSGTTVISEQEADRFAGFILAKMGATEEQAMSALRTLPDNAPISRTHPPKFNRLMITKAAWREGHQR